jgi:hypothetical protein
VAVPFSLDTILGLIPFLFFMALMFYGQNLQLYISMRNVSRQLRKLEKMKNDARGEFVSQISQFNSDKTAVTRRIDTLLELFAISPVSLDPRGIVPKLEHILDAYEERMKADVKQLAVGANEDKVSTLTNLLEVSLGLNTIYRVVRHYYLSTKKSKSLFTLMQLQFTLPFIMEIAEAYHASLSSFTSGKPIGDGIGPLVASKLMDGLPSEELVKDTVVARMSLEDRQIILVKAKGPGGNVGKPGEAVRRLLEKHPETSMVLTVDAGLKLEGETTGEIVEGIGAAIGGPGIDRYKVEEVATASNVPLHAIVVKMSEKEAITTMDEKIEKTTLQIVDRVKSYLVRWTKPGDTVIVAGIGNSLGIGQQVAAS